MVTQSKFMVASLILFIGGYGLMGYVFFSRGFSMIQKIPGGVGGFVSDRVLHVIFFCFSLMLLFSVGVTNFIGLIKGREVGWLMTLPVTRRVVFLWKSTEAILFASWGLVFISAPLLVAFARVRGAPLDFYPHSLLLVVPFVIISATLGSILFLAILRWVSRNVAFALAGIGIIAVTAYALNAYFELQSAAGGRMIASVAIKQVLRHTSLMVEPIWPSSWLSRVLLLRSGTFTSDVWGFTALLWSWALMGIVVMSWLGRFWFYPAWNCHLKRGAEAASRRRDRAQGLAYGWVHGRHRVLGLSRPLRSVIRKDFLTFIREPSQWAQFVIVFGLLLLYVLNLRNMGYDYANRFWAAFVSYINLTICSLAVSTLTTRFVFPQFSLEGTRLWVLGMAPLGLDRVVLQKWVQAFLGIGLLTAILQLISGMMLGLPIRDVLFYTCAVGLMSMGLCGIAVGLGALFPNLEESNAAKIVSGFGGTLCLICSFLYILCSIGSLSFAKTAIFKAGERGGDLLTGAEGSMPLSLLLMVGVTLVFGGLPMLGAIKRARKFEFRGPLG